MDGVPDGVSPLPWFIEDGTDGIIRDAANKWIAKTSLSHRPQDFAAEHANAAFIVRACNSHQSLTDALHAVDVLLDAVVMKTDGGVELLGPIVRDVVEASANLKAALLKAQENR